LTLLQVPPSENESLGPAAEDSAGSSPAITSALRGFNPIHVPALGLVGSPGEPSEEAVDPATGLPALPDAPEPAVALFSDRALPLSPDPTIDAILDEIPEAPSSPAAWFLLPVVWANRFFDRSTLALGESGLWLRSPTGRMLLGLTGLGMLAGAGLWMVRDWFGWTW
jgi:hypothetical protein